MMAEQDFERIWIKKLTTSLDRIAGEQIRDDVMQGSEKLSSLSERGEVIGWSKGAMERLESLVDEERAQEIMTGCACQYPKSNLREIKEKFAESGDIELAHQMLQEQFISFLKNTMQLSDKMIQDIVKRGWGAAGILHENGTIIATKIPKSGNLVAYIHEQDLEEKRQYYCHCPRVRDALKLTTPLPLMYCYCGAGFYKSIWEEILQQTVKVEILKSVMTRDEVCQIAIHLPLELAGAHR